MSILRLSSAATVNERFAAVRALFPSASVAFALLHDEPGLCVIRASVARWPQDPAPAIAHAAGGLANVADADWRWSCNFGDVRDAALDRACQNLWLPSALAEGPSDAERWKAQHAALSWLWQRAGRERDWQPARVASYRYLAAELGFTDPAAALRFEAIMAAESPVPATMAKMVEYFGGRADAERRLLNLPMHLSLASPAPEGLMVPATPVTAVALKTAFFARHPDATIQTSCVKLRDGAIAIHAAATLTPEQGPVGGGFEIVVRGKGPSLLSLVSVETCETRAVADLLVKLGVEVSGVWPSCGVAGPQSVDVLLQWAEPDTVGTAAIRQRIARGGLTEDQVARCTAHYAAGGRLDGHTDVTLEAFLRAARVGTDPGDGEDVTAEAAWAADHGPPFVRAAAA